MPGSGSAAWVSGPGRRGSGPLASPGGSPPAQAPHPSRNSPAYSEHWKLMRRIWLMWSILVAIAARILHVSRILHGTGTLTHYRGLRDGGMLGHRGRGSTYDPSAPRPRRWGREDTRRVPDRLRTSSVSTTSLPQRHAPDDVVVTTTRLAGLARGLGETRRYRAVVTLITVCPLKVKRPICDTQDELVNLSFGRPTGLLGERGTVSPAG